MLDVENDECGEMRNERARKQTIAFEKLKASKQSFEPCRSCKVEMFEERSRSECVRGKMMLRGRRGEEKRSGRGRKK